MSASFFNAYTLALTYDSNPTIQSFQNSPPETQHARRSHPLHISSPQKEAAEAFRQDMVHTMSLLHALCLQHLRADYELGNLETHSTGKLPSWDSATTPGFLVSPINFIFPRPRMKARFDLNRAAKLPVVGGVSAAEREALGPDPIRKTKSTTKNPNPKNHSTKSTNSLEEESEVHPAGWWQYNLHRSRLGLPSGLYAPSRLFAPSGMNFVGCASERPYKVLYAVLERLRRRMNDGGLKIEAPILANVWTNINVGVRAFEHCCYLLDTPFPFPWAQLIIVVL